MSPSPTLAAQVAALEAEYVRIARTTMQGLPVMHPRLFVQAVGFVPRGDDGCPTGVLITPWFMNLVRLPRRLGGAASTAPEAKVPPIAAMGRTVERRLGGLDFPFIGGVLPGLGAYEACSLSSPMHEYADQAAAVATAQAVLQMLDAAAEHETAATTGAPGHAAAIPAPQVATEAAMPSRRRWLLGRAARDAELPGAAR